MTTPDVHRKSGTAIDSRLSAGHEVQGVAGVYIVTNRTFEDRTFQTKASHRSLAIGQSPLAASL